MAKQILAGWDTVRRIGAGGFGKVYEIKKSGGNNNDVRSALKVITIPPSQQDYQSFVDDGYDRQTISQIYKDQVDKIMNELNFMARFRGTTNIVSYEDHQVIEHADKKGWDILVRMELLTSLPEYYNKTKITDKDVVKVGIDICHALGCY